MNASSASMRVTAITGTYDVIVDIDTKGVSLAYTVSCKSLEHKRLDTLMTKPRDVENIAKLGAIADGDGFR